MKLLYPSLLIQTDSRSIAPGDLFVALKGERVDGHNFLQEAKERGATHALVRNDYRGNEYGLTLLRTEDPLLCLQRWAREKVERKKPKIVAITGSVGKTSTKEFLFALLSRKFSIAKSKGNQNSQVGLPVTLLNDWKEEPFLIVEMGMADMGEIKKLIQIAPPDIAAITEITGAHLEKLGSLENIAQAKGEIFDSPTTRFGLIKKGMIFEELLRKRGICEKLLWQIEETRYPVPKLPSHLIGNFHLACRIAELLGVPRTDMEAASLSLPSIEGRFHRVLKGGITFIDDGYNACELSSISALSNLTPVNFPECNRKIALFGEMRELGAESSASHTRVGKKALETVDCLFLLGEGTRPMEEVWKGSGKEVRRFATTLEAEAFLKGFLQTGDLVWVKGARGWALSEMVARWPS